MSLAEPFTEIEPEQWVATAIRHQQEGRRLVQMTGTARADHFEIMVSYDLAYQCLNYRIHVPRSNPELPSISGIFAAAFTYENELKDLFGFSFPGLTVDYGGNFLRTKTKLPFAAEVVVKKGKPAKPGKTAKAEPTAEPAPAAEPGN